MAGRLPGGVCRPEEGLRMITPIDVLCLAIFVGVIALEGHRGVIPAAVDLLCVFATAFIARRAYGPLSPYIGTPSWTYVLVVVILLGLTALLSIFVSRRLKVMVTPLEATISAVIGLISAAVLVFILFEWVSVRYGPDASILKKSLMAWQLHDFAGFRALADLLRQLRGVT